MTFNWYPFEDIMDLILASHHVRYEMFAILDIA